LVTLLCASACSADDSGGTASNAGGAGSGATGGKSSDGSAGTGASSGSGGVMLDGSAADACVAEKLVAKLEKKPVDVIVLVDTSATMAPASAAVEDNINGKFASVLGASNLDYRVVVLAGYGANEELCVSPPLGGASCSPPPSVPANTSQFFHYPRASGSGALLQNIIDWYNAPDSLGTAPNGWSGFVRTDSLKVFLIFSDTSSSSSIDGSSFESQLLALTPAVFGTASARNYIFHTIIGLGENSPATSPWMPSDPVVSSTCSGYSGSLGPGEPLQNLSKLTGGLRFPICQFAAFDVVFQALAQSVVTTTPLECEFPFPTPPAGKTIDPNTIQLDYTPGTGGPTQSFTQVKSLADCTPSSFYVENQTIILCPDACTAVKADSSGNIDVRFGCDVGFVK